MAINSIQFVISASATATNGSDVITVTGNADLRNVYSGSAVFLGTRQVVEAISGTAPDVSGDSTLTLRFPWTDPTTTAKLVVFNTIEGLSEAIRRAREVVAGAAEINNELLPLAELATLGFIERTGAAQYATFVATAAGKELLGASTAAAQRTALVLGTASTANVTTSETDSTAGRVVRVQDADLRYASKANLDAIKTVKAIKAKATFYADFVNNEFRVYEAPYGQESKAITDAITTTRASDGTVNTPFGIETRASNIARIEYDPVTGKPLGLLGEINRTNILLNSDNLATQSVAVTAQVYSLTIYGTGSVTLSGAATGTLTGAGDEDRVLLNFTPTAGSLTLTVTGDVTFAQLEDGPEPTAYIPTAGAAATRVDELNRKTLTGLFNNQRGTLYWSGYINDNADVRGVVGLCDAVDSKLNVVSFIHRMPSRNVQFVCLSDNGSSSLIVIGNSLAGVLNKVALTYNFDTLKGFASINGAAAVEIDIVSKPTDFSAANNPLTLGRYRRSNDPQQNQICSEVMYIPSDVTPSELAALTGL